MNKILVLTILISSYITDVQSKEFGFREKVLCKEEARMKAEMQCLENNFRFCLVTSVSVISENNQLKCKAEIKQSGRLEREIIKVSASEYGNSFIACNMAKRKAEGAAMDICRNKYDVCRPLRVGVTSAPGKSYSCEATAQIIAKFRKIK